MLMKKNKMNHLKNKSKLKYKKILIIKMIIKNKNIRFMKMNNKLRKINFRPLIGKIHQDKEIKQKLKSLYYKTNNLTISRE